MDSKMKAVIAVLAIAGFGALAYSNYSKTQTMATAPIVDAETGEAPAGRALAQVKVPAEFTGMSALGKKAFDANCAVCHGENAAGQVGVAPPLVHKIYESNHHGDTAFLLAAQNGVRSHHWQFGNMPPIDGITKAEVKSIVAYIRVLQRENGIN